LNWSWRFRYNGRRLRRRRTRRRHRLRLRRCNRLLLFPNDCFQHISGLGYVGEINLRLDPVRLGTAGARGFRRRGTFPRCAEVRSNFFSFVVFQGTGMRLFLGDPNFRQHVENGFAFDFQLPGQIVNSNLAHPPLCSSNMFPLSFHFNLTDR
jgi:hypothetical protein